MGPLGQVEYERYGHKTKLMWGSSIQSKGYRQKIRNTQKKHKRYLMSYYTGQQRLELLIMVKWAFLSINKPHFCKFFLF